MFGTLKLWIAGIGAALVGALMLWVKLLRKQRDEARRSRDILIAGRRSSRIKDRIIKEEKEKTISRTAKLVREIKEKKGEEYKGADNLTNSNDDW